MQIQELVREERDRGAQLERKLLEEQTANRKLDSERIEVNLDYWYSNITSSIVISVLVNHEKVPI